MADRHDAFISYSHRDDAVAGQLQHDLERFTKPWWRARSLRVFRDQTNLTAAPDLWQAVVDALDRSDWFILMASPEAAASAWVPREVEWWREHRSVDRILIGLTAGEIVWGRDDFDWTRTTALPSALAGVFPHEPLWVDLRGAGDPPRLGDLVAEFASPIMGRPKDSLIGLHVAQHKRIRRLVGAVIAVLSALVLLAGAAAVVAVRQRATAVDQARIARSRQLAATSTTLRGSDLDLAELLAVEAFRTDPNDLARQALFGAVTASPGLVRFLAAPADLAVLAAAGDGSAVVAGLVDGTVLRWSVADGSAATIGRLPAAATSIATGAHGRTVLAAAGTAVLTWHDDRATRTTTPQPVKSVAVAPSGRLAAIVTSTYSTLVDNDLPDVLYLRTLGAGGAERSVRLDWATSSVAMPSDTEIVVCSLAGAVDRRRVPSLGSVVHAVGDSLGAHGFLPTLSADGAFLTLTNGGGFLPVYPTTGPAAGKIAGWAAGHGNREQTIAISNDGKVAAAVDAGVIYLADTGTPAGAPPAKAVLTGGGSVPEHGLVFLGDGTRFATASGRRLALWDTRQVSRIARRSRVTLRVGSPGSLPPWLSVSPKGRRVAVQPADVGDVLINDLADGATRGVDGLFLGWATDDRFFLLDDDGRVTERDAARPAVITRDLGVFPEDSKPFAVTPDGRRAVLLAENGVLETRDLASGQLVSSLARPAKTTELETAYIDESGTRGIAIVDTAGSGTPEAAAFDLTRGTTHMMGAGSLHAVALTSTSALLQRSDGTLEWWDLAGTTLRKVLRQDRSLVTREGVLSSDPALGDRLVAQRRTDGNLMVTDLVSGAQLGELALPNAAQDVKVTMGFADGDRQLITATEGDDDGQIVRWELTTDAWIAAACASAGRDLTGDEWSRLVGGDPPADLRCLR